MVCDTPDRLMNEGMGKEIYGPVVCRPFFFRMIGRTDRIENSEPNKIDVL